MAFPKNFIWGAVAASYEIEGNTQGVHDCGLSVWDDCSLRMASKTIARIESMHILWERQLRRSFSAGLSLLKSLINCSG